MVKKTIKKKFVKNIKKDFSIKLVKIDFFDSDLKEKFKIVKKERPNENLEQEVKNDFLFNEKGKDNFIINTSKKDFNNEIIKLEEIDFNVMNDLMSNKKYSFINNSDYVSDKNIDNHNESVYINLQNEFRIDRINFNTNVGLKDKIINFNQFFWMQDKIETMNFGERNVKKDYIIIIQPENYFRLDEVKEDRRERITRWVILFFVNVILIILKDNV
ncbi:MAG TPA: hypothetical protein P5277_00600 [Candidatus Paceibacterota bacterium]|nr:hypothetical protein [Candidatus Paceibacterota bacterium]